MKKFILFAAAAATLFASCTKKDVIYSHNVGMDNTIKVTAMIDSDVTKASAVVTDQATIASFKMYAYNDGSSVIPGITFSRPATSGDPWTHEGIYYWATGTYNFYGLAQDNSAANSISGVAVTKDGITIGTKDAPYTIATDGATNKPSWNGTAYEGGIYESAVASVSQPDPVVSCETATRSDSNTGTTVTTMRFYHALSRLRVQLNSYDPKTSHLKLVVVGYEFRQVGVAGYTTKAIATNADAASVPWTVKTTGMVRENSVAIPATFDSAWTGTSKSLIPSNSWCNVIPGNVATALVVKCALYDDNGKWVADRFLTTGDTAVMKNNNTIASYLPGHQYTYKVQVSSDGGADTDKPKNPGLDDPDHDGPDTDVDGLTIKITSVTVEEWSSENGGTAVFTGK